MIPLRSTSTGEIMYVGDGFFGSLGNFLGKTVVGKALGGIAKLIPGGSAVIGAAKSVAKIGAEAFEKHPVITVAGTGAVVAGGTALVVGGGGTAGVPALPGGSVAGMTASKGLGSYAQGSMLPEVLDPSALRMYHRAPKGYVIVRDKASGSVMAVRKDVARHAHLWHPSRKPPISAGDWHRYETARRVEKKLLHIARHALHRHHTPVHSGRVVPFHHRKAA